MVSVASVAAARVRRQKEAQALLGFAQQTPLFLKGKNALHVFLPGNEAVIEVLLGILKGLLDLSFGQRSLLWWRWI